MSGAVRDRVAMGARALVAAGFIDAFGHVSARDGEGFVITPTTPLAHVTPEETIVAELAGDAPAPAPGTPIEAPMHRAIYHARPDVAAVCRTHSPFAVLCGVARWVPPLMHGLGGLSGDVALHDDVQLVDAAHADAVAAALGGGSGLLLAANGALTVGESVEVAFTRAWFLEERCRVAWTMRETGTTIEGAELAERSRHFDPELRRAIRWAEERFFDQTIT